MNKRRSFFAASAILAVALMAVAQGQGVVRPQLILREIVQGMPRADKQEVRVMNVSFQPGDRTLFHRHRFPVTNRSGTDRLRLVAFYVSDPDTPFLDPIQ